MEATKSVKVTRSAAKGHAQKKTAYKKKALHCVYVNKQYTCILDGNSCIMTFAATRKKHKCERMRPKKEKECQSCKYHSNKPSWCNKHKEYVSRKGCCASYRKAK